MAYISKNDLLRRMARREADVTLPGGRLARIRELSLRDRLDAQDAGKPDEITRIYTDIAMFRAVMVQRGLLTGPGGELMFTPEDVPTLAEARDFELSTSDIRLLSDEIWLLSEADPDSFRDDSQEDVATVNSDDDDSRADASGAGGSRRGRKRTPDE